MMDQIRHADQDVEEANADPIEASAEDLAAQPEAEAPPPLEVCAFRVGRLAVPEDADDILSFVHRQQGVVNVWLTGDTVSVESEPGAFDCEACVAQLYDQGFPVSA